jgi:signal-transduction protein with cAMP-binding, CBS, and nucleotidyltransferase domain
LNIPSFALFFFFLFEAPVGPSSPIAILLTPFLPPQVPFFKDCQPHFLVAVVKVLMPRIYLPGDYIIVKGQYGKEMYFIRTGDCKVLNNDGGVICTLSDGKSFGEVSPAGC